MQREQAEKIMLDHISEIGLPSCRLEVINFVPENGPPWPNRARWAGVIAYNVDEDDDAYYAHPCVCVDDETGEVWIVNGL